MGFGDNDTGEKIVLQFARIIAVKGKEYLRLPELRETLKLEYNQSFNTLSLDAFKKWYSLR